MPTGQAVVNRALTTLGILEQGGQANVSDSNAVLDELNAMWDAWSIDEGLIYAQIAVRFPITTGLGVYTIGPSPSPFGATPNVNSPVPARIYRAHFIQVTGGAIATKAVGDGGTGYVVNDTGVIINSSGAVATYTVNSVTAGAVTTFTVSGAGTGYLPGNGYQTQVGGGQPGSGSGFTVNIITVSAAGQNRNQIDVVPADEYYGHGDLNASSASPDELYPDYLPDGDGFERIYLYPVPNAAGNIELDTGVNFNDWALVDNYNVPPGYGDDINWCLAERCIPMFGVAVVQSIVDKVNQKAAKAEIRVREANKKNRQLQPGTEQLITPTPPTQQ